MSSLALVPAGLADHLVWLALTAVARPAHQSVAVDALPLVAHQFKLAVTVLALVTSIPGQADTIRLKAQAVHEVLGNF